MNVLNDAIKFRKMSDILDNDSNQFTSVIESTADILECQYRKIKRELNVKDEKFIEAMDMQDQEQSTPFGKFFAKKKQDVQSKL